jgi:capsular polysaccharide biosynthesis protein
VTSRLARALRAPRRAAGKGRRALAVARDRSRARHWRPGPVGAEALRSGAPLDGSERQLLDLVDEALAETRRPHVAVLGPAGSRGYARMVRAAHPDATVVWASPANGMSRVHSTLAASGRFDLLLDVTGEPRRRGKIWRATFLHLRAGGRYVARDAQGTSLPSMLARVRSAAAVVPEPYAPRALQDDHSLGRAVVDVHHEGSHLVVRNGVDALAKLTEPETVRLLALRPEGPDRSLTSVPAASFRSRATFATNADNPRIIDVPTTYDAPEAHLREYHDVLCLPGQVVVSGNLLLPDTYRHNARRRLTNKFTDELAHRFATLPPYDESDVVTLEGTYFYLDDEIRGHFGHAMTEQLSRLWAMSLVRELVPDVKAVMAINKGREIQPFEVELYGTVGFARDDLLLLHTPARVERLLAATPMFSMPEYVHPEISHTWRKVGHELLRTAPDREYAERIFVSRRIKKRACRNTDEVEKLFASHGFEIVYPEDYPLGEQIAMFQHADVIGGFAGSGLFHLCFVETPKRVVMILHEHYTAQNEYMMASVHGHDIVSVVSRADLERGTTAASKAFQSSFAFDLEREGRYLTSVLDGL